MTEQTNVSPRMLRVIGWIDRGAIFISRHWLLLVSLLVLLYIALPALAPVLMEYGYTGPAQVIYTVYRFTCHQLAYRSFFLFGAQPVYALDQMRTMFTAPANDLFFYSSLTGSAEMGYKMAWCERDVAIYTSVFVAGLLFGLVRGRVRPLDWRVYVLLLTPLVVDGFWQLFTSPEQLLPFLPPHESDWLLRTVTGVLFGAGSVWLIYPYVEQAMRDVLDQSQAQLRHVRVRQADLQSPSQRKI